MGEKTKIKIIALKMVAIVTKHLLAHKFLRSSTVTKIAEYQRKR